MPRCARKARCLQQPPVRPQRARERERLRRAPRQRLRQPAPHQRGGDHADAEGHDEVGAPAERGLQHAADERRDDRRERHDGAHQRQLAAGARAGIEVAHDRAHHHDRARAAQRLERARRDQRLRCSARASRRGWRRRTARARTAGSGAGRSGRTPARSRSGRARRPPDRPTGSVARSATGAASTRLMSGIDGRYMSVDTGPSAVIERKQRRQRERVRTQHAGSRRPGSAPCIGDFDGRRVVRGSAARARCAANDGTGVSASRDQSRPTAAGCGRGTARPRTGAP